MRLQNPAGMSADEIIREVESLRESLESSSKRLLALSHCLYIRARRQRLALHGEEEPEDPTPYAQFANAWLRMGSSFQQSLQRIARTARWVAPQKHELEIPRLPEKSQRQPSMKDLTDLYGEEIVNYATE